MKDTSMGWERRDSYIITRLLALKMILLDDRAWVDRNGRTPGAGDLVALGENQRGAGSPRRPEMQGEAEVMDCFPWSSS